MNKSTEPERQNLSKPVDDQERRNHVTESREAHECYWSRREFLMAGGTMATVVAVAGAVGGLGMSRSAAAAIDDYLNNNKQYVDKAALHKATYPGPRPIKPAKRLAILACMDARLDVEDMLGLQTGDAHIIRNAGGVVTEDALRCLIISHHLLDTNEIILIHHTRCGMLAFTDDLLRAGLEGDPKAVELLSGATGRTFVSPKVAAASPDAFHAFRGKFEALDAPKDKTNIERLSWDVRRGMSAIMSHPWIPMQGPDAVTVRGFIYDVDTGLLEEVSYPGPMGSVG
jgi:Carbonic anhydrase